MGVLLRKIEVLVVLLAYSVQQASTNIQMIINLGPRWKSNDNSLGAQILPFPLGLDAPCMIHDVDEPIANGHVHPRLLVDSATTMAIRELRRAPGKKGGI